MRRVLSLVVLGVGVFTIAAGLLLRFYAYPALAKAPHEPDTTAVAQGSGITALVYVPDGDGARPEIRRNLSLTSTTYVSGDLSAPEVQKDGDVTVWVEAQRVVEDRDQLVVNASVRELCMDRYTAEAVAPCEKQYLQREQAKDRTQDTKVRGNRNQPQFPGLNFKFPFDTEKKNYRWYDTTLGRAEDIRFDGEDTVKGLDVYRFVQTVPATRIDTRDVPGALIHRPEPTVQADLYYQADRTLWVEPETGAVVKVKQAGRQVLRAVDQTAGQGTDVFSGTLELNDKTVSANVARAQQNISDLWLLTGLPVILWIVGAVLLGLGVVLLVTERRQSSRHGW